MFKIHVLITAAIILCKACNAESTKAEKLALVDRNFQIDFLNEVRNTVNNMAREQLNRFLQHLKSNNMNSKYTNALENATNSNDVRGKVVFVKQFLDVENLEHDPTGQLESIALRNVNFLTKLDEQLHKIEDDSIAEIRQIRMYQLCKQFHEKSTNVHLVTLEPPYAVGRTKLMPLNENIAMGEGYNNQTPKNIAIELNEFGRELYSRVNVSGGEIIDDYLKSLRELLQEVIVEKHEHEQETSQLSKLLQEIDNILGTSDFYEKRQKLYEYLEQNLAADYEQFKSSEHAQEDFAEVLTKLRERGLDLFVTFLFSNFEFLECLHKELAKLLPKATNGVEYDEVTRLLFDVHTSYSEFKRVSESNDKYEAYMERVKALHSRTTNLGDDAHIFELLHNAALNVGSVTLNMIRAKCNEI